MAIQKGMALAATHGTPGGSSNSGSCLICTPLVPLPARLQNANRFRQQLSVSLPNASDEDASYSTTPCLPLRKNTQCASGPSKLSVSVEQQSGICVQSSSLDSSAQRKQRTLGSQQPLFRSRECATRTRSLPPILEINGRTHSTLHLWANSARDSRNSQSFHSKEPKCCRYVFKGLVDRLGLTVRLRMEKETIPRFVPRRLVTPL